MLKENEIRPSKGATKDRKRLGRGNASGHGGESGRGHKGQKSRSGYSRRAGFEGGQTPLYRRIPKRRGLGNLSHESTTAINLNVIDTHFSENDVVDIHVLREKGLLSRKSQPKILSQGELTKKVVFRGLKLSKTALKKAELASALVE